VADIWNVHGDCLNPDVLNMKSGSPWTDVWFYNGFDPSMGPELINGESLGFRTWQWVVWQNRLSGLCDWEFGWIRDKQVFREMNSTQGPLNMRYLRNVYVYPGEQIGLDGLPLPSIRMKMMRRSNQDYEYLWLVSEKTGNREFADRIVNRLLKKSLRAARPLDGPITPDPDTWSHRPADWYEARLEIAKEILR
jgi:hypothetical protein